MTSKNNIDTEIAALCVRCDLASIAASSSLEQVAGATSKRKRAQWRKEHVIGVGALDKAAYNLVIALWVQPLAVDTITPSMRKHAERIHTYATRSLNVFRA